MIFELFIVIAVIIIIILLYKISEKLTDIRVDLSDHESNKSEIDYWISKEILNKESEYEALLRIIYSTVVNPILTEENRKSLYNDLKDAYEENFIQLGHEFPKYPTNEK